MNLTGFSICITSNFQITYSDSCISDISQVPITCFKLLRIPKRHAECFSSGKREKRG